MVENGANRSQGNATPAEIRFVPGNRAHAMPSRYGLAGEGREEGEWPWMEMDFVEKFVMPWSSGKQLSLDNLTTNWAEGSSRIFKTRCRK